MTKTAIVVDDHTDMRSVLCEMLEMHGVDVIGEGQNGRDAVELCQSLRPDIVLLDVNMPDYDGVYALKEITSLDLRPVVVMVTGDKSSITADRIEKIGEAKIIYKPPKIDEVIEIIDANRKTRTL